MDYDIVSRDNTVEVIISGGGYSETVTMFEEPSEECILVQQSKKEVLGQINLKKMLTNLDDCVDLLQITFNAVDGFAVQSKVQELSMEFSNAMIKSNATALEFKFATQMVVEAYVSAYDNLFYGEIETALSMLTDIKPIAKKMVERSDELVRIYDALASSTNSILKEVIDERSADEQKRSETKELIAQLDGSIKALNKLKENLAEDIKGLEEDYSRLEKQEMEQEKRAYGMQLAAVIIKSIGGLFGTASESTKQEREESERMAEKDLGEASAETKAKRDYAANIGEQEKIKSQINKIEERESEIDAILEGQLFKGGDNNEKAEHDNPDTKKTDEELRDEKRTKIAEKERLNDKLNNLKGEEKTLGNELKKFGVAIDGISDEIRTYAQDIQKKADSLLERMDNIRKQRNELKDRERENIVKLAEYTAKMENAVINENSLESAIQSLVIAIGCLRRVLAYLQEIKLFWMNVESFCDNLANNDGITKLISSKENRDVEQRAAYFKTKMFVKGYIQNVSKWKALNVIFSEYLEALSEVAKRLNKSFEQVLEADRTVQWKLASKLAGQLKTKLKSEAAEMAEGS